MSDNDKEGFKRLPSSVLKRKEKAMKKVPKPPAVPKQKEERFEEERIAREITPSRAPRFKVSIGGANIISVGALVLAILALLIASQGAPSYDREKLQELSANIRELKNKEITVEVPVNAVLYINTSVPGDELFVGAVDVPVYVEIPIDQEVSGADVRTGVPLTVRLSGTIETIGNISVNLSRDDVYVRMEKPIVVNGTITQSVVIGDVYGEELDRISELVEEMSK